MYALHTVYVQQIYDHIYDHLHAHVYDQIYIELKVHWSEPARAIHLNEDVEIKKDVLMLADKKIQWVDDEQ